MIWLAAVLCACVALSALSYARAGWALWRMRRMVRLVRTGSMDSREALRAFAYGLRALGQGWIGRALGKLHLWRMRRAHRKAKRAIGKALAPALRELVRKCEEAEAECETGLTAIEALLSSRDL